MIASGLNGLLGAPSSCPHCGGEFRVARVDTTRYLLCTDCGLVRMLPFAALNPGSSLLDSITASTAV